jgi:decaprenyl-phosphate phosphoribosyltransferase
MLRQPSKADFCSSYLLSLRPQQWTKNLIVFAAPLFAFDLNLSALLGSSIAFLCFCSLSSSFYLINDIADVESDRLHPVKCKRPIASGLVPIPMAWLMALLLMVISLIAGGWLSYILLVILIAYGVLQVAYNLKFKRVPILDIFVIAAGFVLRASAGGIATDIAISPWFILCTIMLSLFLAIEKRKSELRLALAGKSKPRSVLKQYSLPFLSRMESTVTTGTIIAYSLWSAGPVLQGASTKWMMLTIPFVMYGIFRYQFLSDPREVIDQDTSLRITTERPEQVLLQDIPILTTVLGWMITTFFILLFNHKKIIV